MFAYRLAIYSFIFFLFSCASYSIDDQDISKDTLLTDEDLAILNSEGLLVAPCNVPAVATRKKRMKFKYGCFCGSYHPRILSNANGVSIVGLIEAFDKINPIDDLDAICKEHDVCLLKNHPKGRRCNQRMAVQLQSYLDYSFGKPPPMTFDHVKVRCERLVFDMRDIINSPFAPNPLGFTGATTIYDTAEIVVDTVMTPVFAIIAIAWLDLFSGYPKEGERCL